MTRKIRTIVTALALFALPGLAHALDSVGAEGTIAELEVSHTTADTYLQYHGRVVLTSVGRAAEYRWGGGSCSNKSLSESMVTMLQRAMESGSLVTPRFQAGQGTNKCLVGFSVAAP